VIFAFVVHIGITGNALQEDLDEFLSSGVNEILVKPITKAKLIDVLNAQCNRD
jgi:CheY-like chemotaxis protein